MAALDVCFINISGTLKFSSVDPVVVNALRAVQHLQFSSFAAAHLSHVQWGNVVRGIHRLIVIPLRVHLPFICH